jgi:hypothetical protein
MLSGLSGILLQLVAGKISCAVFHPKLDLLLVQSCFEMLTAAQNEWESTHSTSGQSAGNWLKSSIA